MLIGQVGPRGAHGGAKITISQIAISVEAKNDGTYDVFYDDNGTRIFYDNDGTRTGNGMVQDNEIELIRQRQKDLEALQRLLLVKERLRIQQAKSKWIKQGDANTSFFHGMVELMA